MYTSYAGRIGIFLLRSRFHSTRHMLIIVIIELLHFPSAINKDRNYSIHWKLMTKSVHFGHDVDLVCVIKTEDTSEPMAWIRIPNGETIAYNKNPTDNTKYRIGVQYNDTILVYKLTIKQFNSTDVNRVYRCDFGFYSYSDKLMLNNKDFISIPSNTDVEFKFTLAEDKLSGRIKIENCFPQPMCTGIFQGKNISEFMTIKYTNVSIFFNTHIEIKYRTDICEGFVNVTCTYGDNNLYFQRHVGDCSGKSNSKSTVALIIVGILSGVVLALGIIFVWIAKRKRISCCKLRLGIDSYASYNRAEGGEGENRSNGNSDEIEPMSKQLTVQTTYDSGIGLSTPACNKEELLRATESEEAEDLMEECR